MYQDLTVSLKKEIAKKMEQKTGNVKKVPQPPELSSAVTRIRTWVTAATTQGTNHYTITAIEAVIEIHSID